jgi:ATP-dependent DNA helicase RecG
MTEFDPTPYVVQDEGQHYERKSLFEGPPGSKKARPRREVRDQVAEYVAAFANAEGGILLLGVEDDGEVTGHRYAERPLESLLNTPASRLEPRQSPGFTVEHDGVELIVFDVQASDVPVKVTGDGYPLRMGDQTIQASESQIRSLKFQGMAESWESRPSMLGLEDLDRDLISRAKSETGLRDASDVDYLLRRKLADRRGAGISLRRAAELVFATYGPDHPNAGVRIFRVVGTERRLGPEHNVEERPRIEGNLPSVLEETTEVIGGLLRRPSRLVGSKFQPMPEYPEFAWKEAVLNAVAHRDYAARGRCTEVWLFDDRMEVRNPGQLVAAVTIEGLRRQERLHASRNPRSVRALVDLGYMRDQGEGVPRMFHEMQGNFLPEPELEETENSFAVTLRNTPTLSESDRQFVAKLDDDELTRDEFRALLEAYRRGRVDNSIMRQIAGLDTLQASQLLRRLRDRGLLELHAAGAASFYTLDDSITSEYVRDIRDRSPREQDLLHFLRDTSTDKSNTSTDQSNTSTDQPDTSTDQPDTSTDQPDTSTDQPDTLTREELLRELPEGLREEIDSLKSRAPLHEMQDMVRELCAWRPLKPRELNILLKRSRTHVLSAYIKPLVDAGELVRTHPETPQHPEQAYTVPPRDDEQ